jgi:ribonuclease G
MRSGYNEIFVNVCSDEMRVAVLENHALVELLTEPSGSGRILGNIFKGKVVAVLPGMQAAFIDIGIGKNVFLPFSDVCSEYLDIGEMFMEQDSIDEDIEFMKDGSRGRDRVENIIQKDQEVLVQVIKEPMGNKGARVTTQISLPGWLVVLLPWTSHIGISKKIEDPGERTRLKRIIKERNLPSNTGAIIRTAAAHKSETDLLEDMNFLLKKWRRIDQKAKRTRAPGIIDKELPLPLSMVRDLFSSDVDLMVIDSPPEYNEIMKYLKSTAPDLRSRVKLYEGEVPLFDQYGIEEAIEQSLHRKVWLKRGGYITIDTTEALTAIDVNTGRYTGKDDQETTILEVNLEAAQEIARQLRLRDIGGLIVIDFIDLTLPSNWQKVLECFEEHLQRDRLKTKTLKVSEMGLVEMTRKKVRPNLWERYTEVCPYCEGTGRILSKAFLSRKIERQIVKSHFSSNARNFLIRMNPELALYMLEEREAQLNELKSRFGIEIEIIDNPALDYKSYRIHPKPSSR